MRKFIYLDESEIFSLSSQMFEGIAEYITNEVQLGDEKHEDQKGPVGSGKVMGDILKNVNKTVEQRYLKDYSYVLFEDEIEKNDNVDIITDEDTLKEYLKRSEKKPFIKIVGKVVFHDTPEVIKLLENFNIITTSISEISNQEELQNLREERNRVTVNGSSKKANSSKLKQYDEEIENIRSQLNNDSEFLKNMVTVLDFGYEEQLSVLMPMADHIFTAELKRQFLREKENILIRKYSRKTEIELTLFGLVTQCGKEKASLNLEENEESSMKKALMRIVEQSAEVESSFVGISENEIIIDPIALYRDLR